MILTVQKQSHIDGLFLSTFMSCLRKGLITGHVPAQISELNSTCGSFEYPALALQS